MDSIKIVASLGTVMLLLLVFGAYLRKGKRPQIPSKWRLHLLVWRKTTTRALMRQRQKKGPNSSELVARLRKGFLPAVEQILRAVRVVRALLIISAGSAIALSLPDQIVEIYRVLAQDLWVGTLFQAGFAFFFAVLASIVVWLLARNLTFTLASEMVMARSIEGALLRWLPRICGALILVGMAAGLWRASQDPHLQDVTTQTFEQFPIVKQVRDQIAATSPQLWGAAFIVSLTALILVLCAYLRTKFELRTKRKMDPLRLSRRALLSFVFSLVAIIIYFTILPVDGPQILGSIATFLIFVIALALVTTMLSTYFDRSKIPAIGFIIFMAILYSAFNWNDNHAIRTNERPSTRLTGAKQIFDGWLKTRQDRDHYKNALKQPYPVFLVTAAGGGLYASYHAATVLARLQDRCPNFAHHVFAISSVSGGSLGAAIFAALASRYDDNSSVVSCTLGPIDARSNTSSFEARVARFFDGDFLAPVLASGLFPDFLQRFLPFPIDAFDRARALEASFERAWERAAPEKKADNPFVQLFLDFSMTKGEVSPSGQPRQTAPALVLNATDVEQGRRVVISPFIIHRSGSPYQGAAGVDQIHNYFGPERFGLGSFNRDLRLSTAVGLSARFPWILPAGLVRQGNYRLRVLDGGIFDNSGVETALDLLDNLKEVPDIKVHLLVITSVDAFQATSWQGIGELLSPVRALLSTRSERGNLAIYRGTSRFEDEKCVQKANCTFKFLLNRTNFWLPLGWQLASPSRRAVELHSGLADRSETPFEVGAGDIKAMLISRYITLSDRSACGVVHVLEGRQEGRLRC